MDKILVELYVPILEASYDVFIPPQPQMADVLQLMSKAVMELSEGRFVPNDSTALCDRMTGSILDVSKTALELNIKNGSKLMLI